MPVTMPPACTCKFDLPEGHTRPGPHASWRPGTQHASMALGDRRRLSGVGSQRRCMSLATVSTAIIGPLSCWDLPAKGLLFSSSGAGVYRARTQWAVLYPIPRYEKRKERSAADGCTIMPIRCASAVICIHLWLPFATHITQHSWLKCGATRSLNRCMERAICSWGTAGMAMRQIR
jgi:hypothetical protein